VQGKKVEGNVFADVDQEQVAGAEQYDLIDDIIHLQVPPPPSSSKSGRHARAHGRPKTGYKNDPILWDQVLMLLVCHVDGGI